MVEVRASEADARMRRELLVGNVLPNYMKRCGPQCTEVWKKTVGSATGIGLP